MGEDFDQKTQITSRQYSGGLYLAMKNPAPKQSRKKYWANLKIVWGRERTPWGAPIKPPGEAA